MRYGLVFLFLSFMCGYSVIVFGGLGWLCLWPMFSFFLVALAYLSNSTFLFGKRSDGSILPIFELLLFPYLLLLRFLWNMNRLLSKEKAFHRISDNLWIGRRLLAHEYPKEVEIIVDLTCELVDPESVRREKMYILFPILDGSIPEQEQLKKILSQLRLYSGNIYIHCAQGHGRTGLFASVYLLEHGMVGNIEEAMELLRSKRPNLCVNAKQMKFLKKYQENI